MAGDKYTYKDIAGLTPYKNNARTHSAEQIEKIADSIREFGFINPVLVDADGGIIAGHGRVEAAKLIGMTEVPTLLIDHLTEAQKRAYIIADNRLAEDAGWDDEILRMELIELDSMDFNIELTGFDLDFIQEEPEVEEDDCDLEPPEEPKARQGEIYQLGEHRLMCGDSAKGEDVEILMGGAKADMVFTDPPYGVAIGSKNEMLNSFQGPGRCAENIRNDDVTLDELKDILVAAMTNCKNACTDSASYYVASPQGGGLGEMMMMMMMMKESGLEVRHVLMWVKNSPTFSMGRLDYDYQHEPIMYTWAKKHNFYGGGKHLKSVWMIDKPRKCDLHPTMKPVELVANAVGNSSRKGDIVLDLFGGSGTTLIACEQLGRKCCMMELDPKYVDVIIRRWEEYTGEKAVKLNGNKETD